MMEHRGHAVIVLPVARKSYWAARKQLRRSEVALADLGYKLCINHGDLLWMQNPAVYFAKGALRDPRGKRIHDWARQNGIRCLMEI